MYEATTRGIKVTVQPAFLPEQSEPGAGRWVFAYTVVVANGSPATVQLKSRHWKVTDARGRMVEVRGEGVVGEQPVLEPGGSFEYTSGTQLPTPSGIMAGTYQMQDEEGMWFDVEIPAFSLDSPDEKRPLN